MSSRMLVEHSRTRAPARARLRGRATLLGFAFGAAVACANNHEIARRVHEGAATAGADTAVDGGTARADNAEMGASGGFPTADVPVALDLSEACEAMPRLNGEPIVLDPARPISYSHTTAPCEAVPAGILVVNEGAESITLNAVGASPSDLFHVAVPPLPLSLAPGESLRVALSYRGVESAHPETGKLQLLSDEGCETWDIRGLAVLDGVISQSDHAIDFGTVRPGTSPLVHEMVLRYQRRPDFLPAEFLGFEARPPEVFEIIEAPETPFLPESCEVSRVVVRFTPPNEVGPVEGFLLWRVLTGTAEGTAIVDLFADVVDE